MTVRVIGFDDAPFTRADAEVCVSGVVCAGTRFEGMLWGRVTRDGEDGTAALAALLGQSTLLGEGPASDRPTVAVGAAPSNPWLSPPRSSSC